MKKFLALSSMALLSFGFAGLAQAGSGATIQVDVPTEIVKGEPVIIGVIFQAYDSCSAAGTVDLIVDGDVVATMPTTDDNVDGVAEIGVPYEFPDTGDHKVEAIWRAIDGCFDGAPVASGEMQSINVVESDKALATTGNTLGIEWIAGSVAGLVLGLGLTRFALRRR